MQFLKDENNVSLNNLNEIKKQICKHKAEIKKQSVVLTSLNTKSLFI